MSKTTHNPNTTSHLREKPLLLGFAVQKEHPEEGIQISIRWGRTLAALVLLLIIGWTGVTGTLYAVLKYKQGIETVTFTNTVLLQRSEIRRKIGDHNIRESIVQIESGNYNDAFRLLHFGVARSPGNFEGRKLIADFYEFGRQRSAIAADYLVAGLENGGIEDLEYVKQLLRVLLRNQMDERIQEIAATYLPEEPELTEINRTLALGAANACYNRGSFDRAEDYLINYNLMESVEGLLISSKISWDRGNRTAAIAKLEQMLNSVPESDGILAQLSSYYREMGNMDKARRFAMLRSLKNSSNHRPRLELLYIYEQTDSSELLEAEIERFFEQFGTDKDALIEFANFAAKTGNVDLAKRIQLQALENEFETGVFKLLLLEAKIVSQDYAGALDFAEDLTKKKSEWPAKHWDVFNGLRSVAAFGIKRPDLGEVYLQNFLKETNQNPVTYIHLANHFLTIDRLPQAHKVLTAAYQQFPKNQKVLTELVNVELELGNTEKLSELLNRLLTMRRPSTELLKKVYRELSSDRFIFTENRNSLLLQIGSILKENNQSLSLLETSL